MRDQRDDTQRSTTGRAARKTPGRRASAARAPRRGQRGEERRKELIRTLRGANEPVLGSDLAQQFGVSRQVLVQDMAILRAAGTDIIATPRGYLLRNPAPLAHRDVLHVTHGRDAMVDEMTVLVDLGIRILDIAVDHPVFGVLRADLYISSRQDIYELADRLDKSGAAPLFELTGGRHSHTVESPRPDLLERAREQLKQRGYLVA